MAAGSSSAAAAAASFFGIREEDQNEIKLQQQSSIPTSSIAPAPAPQKKKRNLPGTPNPDAEVIALSPKTLMATNRFICEVCGKGFQREQNLQLHRRGHNLPWKLKQKTTKEVKRRVYLCPEPTCVHHDPSRALGDLTGIKKHFCRKHGEKKWKCDKCTKRYAVQSDWKAHSKTCGTREYRCDCGTLFSRRDSFITHRAFCDALAQESARLPTGLNTMGSHLYGSSSMGLGLSQVGSQISSLQDQNHHRSNDLLRLGGTGAQFNHLITPANPSSSFRTPQQAHSSAFFLPGASSQEFREEPHHGMLQNKTFHGHGHGLMQLPELQSSTSNSSSSAAAAAANLFNLSFFSNSSTSSSINNSNNANNSNSQMTSSGLLIPDQFNGNAGGEGTSLFSNNLMGDHVGSSVSSLFNNNSVQNEVVIPQMSATALLQKAAQMGSTASSGSGSLLTGFGSSSSIGHKSDRSHLTANFRANFGGGGIDTLKSQLENENQLQDLMNSLANGGSSIFGAASGGIPNYGHEQETGFIGFNTNRMSLEQHHHQNTNFGNMEDPKLHQNLTVGLGGSDRFTRDFLGVGGVVRSIGGGMSQRDQHGIDISSLDPEMKSASARSFGGGGNHIQ